MEKNNLLELIKELSQAAVNLPQNKKTAQDQPSGSFKTQTTEKPPAEPKKVDRNKRPAPSTDAIIQMIQRHNVLAKEINRDKPEK